MDFFNPHHPLYDSLRSADPASAAACLRPDGDRWWELAQGYAIEQRFDVLIEPAMQAEAEFEDIARKFCNARDRVDAALIAVPPALSRQGILSRYLEEVRDLGQGRWQAPASASGALTASFGELRQSIAAQPSRCRCSAAGTSRSTSITVMPGGAGGTRRPRRAARLSTSAAYG